MDLQQTERLSEADGKCPERIEDGVEMNVDGWKVENQSPDQSSPGPGFPNLSRCAACYNHKKNFLYGGEGESSSSAGDSGPEVDCESEAESMSSSSSSSVEEDEPEKPPSPAGSEDGGKDDKEEDEGKMLQSLAEGTMQTEPQTTPTSSVPQLRPLSRPDTVVSTLLLQVLPQEHDGDAFYIIRQHEEETEERGGEQGGACHLPPQTGWSHPPSQQQHQLSYQQHPQHAYQMFPQHFPLLPVQGQRLPPALHSPPVLRWPGLHSWPQAPSAAQARLDAQSVIMEPSSPKKIQFAVPPLQGQLDPQAAEHIRRRRPTPATLQIYRQPGTDAGDQQASVDSQPSDASQRNQNSYAPPSMKEIQQGVEQLLLGAGSCETESQLSPITSQRYAAASVWANHNGPEETNGNEASLLLANQERGVADSNSSGDLSCECKKDASSPDSVSR